MRGYLLPVTIALGLGVGAVNILGMQIVGQNSSTLNTQYYMAVAKEAAQAGVTVAAKCIRANSIGWSNSATTPLTPATDCSGNTVSGKPSTVANDATLSSSYEVGQLQTVSSTSAVVTSTGKAYLKGPSGITVKTYTQTIRTYATTSVTTTGLTSRAVSQVSTGATTTCSVAEGWVYCWGDNTIGQLGTGYSSNNNFDAYPSAVASNTTTIPGDPGVSHQVCTAYIFFVICISSVTVWDRSPVADQPASALVGAGGIKKNVTKVSVGTNHACAIADGKAYCWGDNTYGQLGNRTNTDSWVPTAVDTAAAYTPPPAIPSPCGGFGQPKCVPVAQPTQPQSALYNKTIVDITAGADFTCALASDATLGCWGHNNHGQLGTNSTTDSNFPVEVYRADAYTIPWSCNKWFGSTCLKPVPQQDIPATALWGKTIKTLATVKASTMCVTDTTNKAYCWGDNGGGQVGDQTYDLSTSNSDSGACAGGATDYPDYPGPGNSPIPDALQAVAVASTNSYDNLVTTNYYTSAREVTGNRMWWWGGGDPVRVSATHSRRVCGSTGGTSGSGVNKYIGTSSSTYRWTSSLPTGPMYNGAAGSGLNQKQLALTGGNAQALFCALTGSDLYCDNTGGNNPTHVYQDGWLLGKTITNIDSTATYSCAVANGVVGCWGDNSRG